MHNLIYIVKNILKSLIGFAHKISFQLKDVPYYSEISLKWCIDTFQSPRNGINEVSLLKKSVK